MEKETASPVDEGIFDPTNGAYVRARSNLEEVFQSRIEYARKSTTCDYKGIISYAMDFGQLLTIYLEAAETLDKRVERTRLVNKLADEMAEVIDRKLKTRCKCTSEEYP